MADDRPTKPRTPSSIQRIAAWGLVEAWLAQEEGRAVVVTTGARGLRLTVIAPWGEAVLDADAVEEPSRVVLRAIEILSASRRPPDGLS